MSSGPFRQFRDWVGDNVVEGLTSEGKQKKYVPHAAQFEYWTSQKIDEILQSRISIIASTKDLPNYICILSILAYIESDGIQGLDYLHEATRRDRDDATLPWAESEQNGIFGDSSVGRQVLLKFIDVQWMFWPMTTQPFLTAHSNMPSRAFMPNGQAKFMFDRRIDRRQIFPITKRPDSNSDVRRAGRRVTVDYMEVHGSLQQQGERSIVPVTVVFKSYPPEELQNYNDVRDGYTAVRNASNTDHILQCLGSFHYKASDGRQYSTIMSELADMTLRDVFLGNELPYQLDHIRAVWMSFLGSLYGLATIHNQKHPRGHFCVHQDLKPSNIFVFRPRDKKNPFSYQLKIGDFGSSYARSVNPAFHNQKGLDRGATRIYGPPETYLNDTFGSDAGATSDMWGIGCIMIELAIWITCGKLGLDEFHSQRMEDTKGLTEHTNLGRSNCFHDGVEALRCVKQVRQTVREYRRNYDTFTSAMVDLALDLVLVPQDERNTAKQLIPRVQRVLKHTVTHDPVLDVPVTRGPVTQSPEPISTPAPNNSARAEQPGFLSPSLEEVTAPAPITLQRAEESSVVSPTLPSPLLPGTSSNNNESALARPNNPSNSTPIPAVGVTGTTVNTTPSATRKSFPPVTMTELREWIKDCKGGIKRELPGFESVGPFLDRRDFIFLIDNSRFTQKYKEIVKDSTTALIELLTFIDRNGIDVANTSASHAQKTIKSGDKMSRFVDQTFVSGFGGDCMIEDALNDILDPIRKRWYTRPTSGSIRRSLLSFSSSSSRSQSIWGVTILIFTNGLWDKSENGTCGANKPIHSLIKWMQDNNIPRTKLSIQFVQLGAEERGLRRLRILDDELNKESDIVDTKPITSSIWDILTLTKEVNETPIYSYPYGQESKDVARVKMRLEHESWGPVPSHKGSDAGSSRTDTGAVSFDSGIAFLPAASQRAPGLADVDRTIVKPSVPIIEDGSDDATAAALVGIDELSKLNYRIINEFEKHAGSMQVVSAHFLVGIRLDLFLQNYFGDETHREIGDVLVVARNEGEYQMLSCRDYMRQTWPSSGEATIEELQKALYRAKSHQINDAQDHLGGILIDIGMEGKITKISIRGPKLRVCDMAAQICWLAAAFQFPDNDEWLLSSATLIPRGISKVSEFRSDQQPTLSFEIDVKTEQTHETSSNDGCWLPLLRCCNIVSGFPILRRSSQQKGIEIALEILAQLAGARQVTAFDGSIVLKGFTSLLVAVSGDYLSTTWHFIESNDSSRIPFTAANSVQKDSNLDLSCLENKRHFLGWTLSASQSAGTNRANYTGIRKSRAEYVDGTMFALSGITLSVSKYVTGGASFTFSKRANALRLEREASFEKKAWDLSRMYAVLYDEASQIGWLIDGASAVLHLLRRQLGMPPYDQSLFELSSFKYSEGHGGPDASYQALKDTDFRGTTVFENYTIEGEGLPGAVTFKRKVAYTTIEHMIEDLWNVFEQMHDHQEKLKPASGIEVRFSRDKLEGWSFIDLLSEPKLRARSVGLTDSAKDWVDFTRAIQAVTFLAKDFGEIIQPIPGAMQGTSNCHMAQVPKGMGYLAVRLQLLKQICDVDGDPDAEPLKLAHNIYWHKPHQLFDQCGCAAGTSIPTCNRVQVVRSSGWSLGRKRTHPGIDMADTEQFRDAAVIFGRP